MEKKRGDAKTLTEIAQLDVFRVYPAKVLFELVLVEQPDLGFVGSVAMRKIFSLVR